VLLVRARETDDAVCPAQLYVKLPNVCPVIFVGAVIIVPVILQFEAAFHVALGITPLPYCDYRLSRWQM